MTKIAYLALGLAAALTIGGAAHAHCGSCGVGGEDSTREECASKCADDADDAACVQACLEAHEKEHEKDASE